MRCYTDAVALLGEVASNSTLITDSVEERAQTLAGATLTELLANRAQCHLKLAHFERALIDTTAVLKRDPRHATCNAQHLHALLQLGRPFDALVHITLAREMELLSEAELAAATATAQGLLHEAQGLYNEAAMASDVQLETGRIANAHADYMTNKIGVSHDCCAGRGLPFSFPFIRLQDISFSAAV